MLIGELSGKKSRDSKLFWNLPVLSLQAGKPQRSFFMLINGISTNASTRAGQVTMLTQNHKVRRKLSNLVLRQIQVRLETAKQMDSEQKEIPWHPDYQPTAMLLPMKTEKSFVTKDKETLKFNLARPEVADMLLSPSQLKDKCEGVQLKEDVQMTLL